MANLGVENKRLQLGKSKLMVRSTMMRSYLPHRSIDWLAELAHHQLTHVLAARGEQREASESQSPQEAGKRLRHSLSRASFPAKDPNYVSRYPISRSPPPPPRRKWRAAHQMAMTAQVVARSKRAASSPFRRFT